jgi:hypothetical protein
MGFSLKKLAEEVIAQVNPWDSGKTAQTVRQARQAAPAVTVRQQAPQPPQQAPSYGKGLTGVVNRARDVVDANTAQDRYKRVAQNRPEIDKTIQDDIRNNLNQVKNNALGVRNTVDKNLTNAVNVARDQVDANTQADRTRRLSTAQPEMYTDQQRAKGIAERSINNNVAERGVNFVRSAAEGMASGPLALGRGLGNAAAMMSGDYKRAQESEKINRDITDQANAQMWKIVRDPNSSQAQKDHATKVLNIQAPQGMQELRAKIASENDPRRLAAAAADTALTVGTAGLAGATKQGVNTAYKGAKATQLATGATLKQATNAGVKAGVKNFATNTAKTAASGAGAGFAGAYTVDPNATLKQGLTGAVQGGVGGAVLPAVFMGPSYIKPTIKAGAQQVPKIVNKAGQSIDDVFNGVRQAYDGLPSKQGGFVANPLNKGDDIAPIGKPPKTEGVAPKPPKTDPLESLNAEAKDIKTRTIKTADGKNEYVAQLGNKVTDRVGRETGFKATATSPNFKSEGEMQKWISKNIDNQPSAPKTEGVAPEKFPGLVDEIMAAPNAQVAMSAAKNRGIDLQLSDSVLNSIQKDRATALDIVNSSVTKPEYRSNYINQNKQLFETVDEIGGGNGDVKNPYFVNYGNYGEKTGRKLTVEFPSSKDGGEIKVLNAEDGQLMTIPYDTAVKMFGTTDQKILAKKIVNGKLDTTTPPKPVAPKSAPIEKTPNPTVTAIEEAGAKIRPVKQVPEKPPIASPEKPVKSPIDNPPEQFDELPVSHTKKVGLLDKAFRSTRSIIERQGKTGKELSGMLQKQRDVKELYVRDLEKRIPTVQKLKDKEYSNFVDATQGLAKPANAKIEKAVAEWKAIHPEIRDRAVKAGLDVGDLGETYYPHFIDYDKVFKDNNTYNQAINHIVKTGQAESREEAIKLLGYARDISRNRQFGNLEASRIVDIPFYDKSKQSLGVYLQGSADRITKTEIFGKNDEIALKKIANIGVEGGDTEAAKNAFDIAVGAKQYNPTSSKISGAVRKYTTVTRLGLGALTNISQNVNTGVVTGHMRTLGAVMKQLSPKTRQWAADTGVISDAVLNDLKHGTGYETFGSTKAGKAVNLITAPGFKQVESLNRKIAATAGRDYGLRLAQKGDEKTLRKLGVTGEIKNNTLTDEQQVQVARKVVEKTQFKVDPQDLPGWADTPGGKLVAQFRTFSYNQGKFFSNEVLKPLAKGNVMPLARVMAALPLGYALYETRRMIDGRPEEENNVKKGLASFQKIGGAGLALDIYQQLNPVGSKYLPSDRRVSMATGALGGPTVGTLSNMVGSISEAIQRKRTPDDESRLDGKIAVGNTGESYTDLTALSRFGLQQIPIVGTPMANRLIPYKKQSDADTGKTSNTATKNPGDGVAKASSTSQLTYDDAIAIQKKEYGGKYADYTEAEIKELAKTDGEAKQYLGSLEATKKAFGSDKELPEGLHPSAAKVYQTENRLTDEGKTKWNAKESNDQYIKDTLKNWNNGEEVPVTNEIAKAWADYEKKRLEGKISNLEMNKEKKAVLRKAYSSVLNEDEKGYYNVPDKDIISGLEQGLVTQESLKKAMNIDALLVSKGLIASSGFGKTVWNALGLNAPKSPTAKTTGTSKARTSKAKSTKVKTSKAKTGGKTATKKGKYNYNLFMFGDAPTKSKSLRELVKKASAKA